MNDTFPPNITTLIAAFAAYFGPTAAIIPFRLKVLTGNDLAIVVHLPEDPEAPTLLGTAGLSAFAVGDGFRAEFALDVKGALDQARWQELADAIVAIASAPLKTGRPFQMRQTLGQVRLPLFEKFGFGMLAEWDPVYGFEFPDLPEPVSLLRIVPLFESEATWIEAQADRHQGYIELVNRGLVPEDYDREPVL
jgi:hypothetical protein